MLRRHHQPDYFLISNLALILISGLFILASASSTIAYQKFQDSYFYFKHQIFYGLIPGLFFLLIFSQIDYHHLKKFALPLFIITLFLLIAVFLPGFGFAHGQAQRWIKIGNLIFQPAELAKLSIILYLAAWLSKPHPTDGRGKESKIQRGQFLFFLIFLGLISLLIILQPNMGTLAIIVALSLIIYFVAGGQISHLITLVGLMLVSFIILIKIAPYRLARITAFFNPSFDSRGLTYQINQALLGIGSGGIFGLGLGHSRQKFLYLPEMFGDSIFAVLAEELGFILTTLFILLLLYFTYRGLKTARLAPDLFGRLLATGISFWFIFQTIINIGAMLNLLPLTGIPLPLVSYGGSAMAIFLAAIGILINISRQTVERGGQ